MCGRYALKTSLPELARRLGVTPTGELSPRYNIAPTQPVLVMRVDDDARRRLDVMRWGLVPSWSKGPDTRYAMHNARVEGITSKPAYRGPVRRRRCLVPADGWYEWQKVDSHKQAWFIGAADATPLCFAGLWDIWERDDGALGSCTILTTAAEPALAHIHPRMPVTAPESVWNAWLNRDLTDPVAALALLADGDATTLKAYPVSSHVNNARNDDPSCLTPLTGE